MWRFNRSSIHSLKASKEESVTKKINRDFTLIELLVVVAIISVLIAMLLPALGSARDQAKKAVCQSNLTQIVMACQFYGDDYTDYLPQAVQLQPKAFSTWGGTCWLQGIYKYLGGTFPIPIETASNFQINKVFLCPVEPNQAWVYAGKSLSNYGYSARFGWNNSTDRWYKARKATMCPSPDQAVMVIDCRNYDRKDAPGWQVFDFNTNYDASIWMFISGRHRGLDNAIFVDGHIGSVDVREPQKNRQKIHRMFEGDWWGW
jgi:prepilin-type N-terminal cleavage/methylation domain-containing protein